MDEIQERLKRNSMKYHHFKRNYLVFNAQKTWRLFVMQRDGKAVE